MRLALLSDTHVPTQLGELPASLLAELHEADGICHAGDIVSLRTLETLRAIVETAAVHGNMDDVDVTLELPDRREEIVAGHRIGLMHGHQAPWVGPADLLRAERCDEPAVAAFYAFLRESFPEAEIIVFGHFHVSLVRRWDGCLFVNPGAVAPGRHGSSFAWLTLQEDAVRVEIRPL